MFSIGMLGLLKAAVEMAETHREKCPLTKSSSSMATPNQKSCNFALAEAYKKGALASGAEVKEIIVGDL